MGVKQCALLLLLCVGVCGTQQYDGVEVSLLTLSYMVDTFEVHAPKWEALTGAKVKFRLADNLHGLMEEINAQVESGFGDDAYLFTSTVMPELADKGYLADLTDLVDEDVQLDWTDIVPFIRRNNVGFNRRVYGLPFDGDALVLVYRDDLVAGPPKTLEELVDEAVRLNGKDLNNDGIPDSGWCECWAPSDDGTVYYIMGDMLMNAVTPYLQSKGSDQGAFFNPETLDALSYTSAWKKAFALLIRLYKEGSDPVRNRCDGRDDGNRYSHSGRMFQNGTCAFHSFWSSNAMVNAMTGKHGNYSRPYLKHSVFPGSTEVDVDGVLTECTKEICPHAKRRDAYGRLVNSAPFAAYGGFIGAIANHSKNVQAAYDFLSYCNRPENSAYDVVLDDGMEPWRISQLLPQLWESKIPSYLVSSFLSTTREILNNENVVIDLRIPGAADFITDAGKVVDMVMRDKIPIEAAPQALKDAWDAVIEKHGGRTRLLPLYRKSLNLPPLQTGGLLRIGSDFSLELYQVALIIVGSMVIVAIIVFAVWRARRSHNMYEKQFNNNIVAERCAASIASMDFEKVEYLHLLEKPNGIQQAFIQIIRRIQEYKAYMPQSLFAEDYPEQDISEVASLAQTDSLSSSVMSANGLTAVTSFVSAQKVTQQLQMAGSKKKVSVFSVHCATPKRGEVGDICKTYNTILDALSSVNTASYGGVLLYTTGDYTTVALNAAALCATHQVKACHIGIMFLELIGGLLHDVALGLGVASGLSVVSNCGTRNVKAFLCIGFVLEKAQFLSKSCLNFASGSRLFFADSCVAESIHGQIRSEPFGVLPHAFKAHDKEQIIYRIIEVQQASHGNEWMYELMDEESAAAKAFASLKEGADNTEALARATEFYSKQTAPLHKELLQVLSLRFGVNNYNNSTNNINMNASIKK